MKHMNVSYFSGKKQDEGNHLTILVAVSDPFQKCIFATNIAIYMRNQIVTALQDHDTRQDIFRI